MTDERGRTMKAGYRYRLRVTPSQAAALQEVFDSTRFVWNTALGRWRDLWSDDRTPYNATVASRELTDWRSRFDWLRALPNVPQHQVLRDLDRALAAFYRGAGRPRFKHKGTHATATWTDRAFSITGGRLCVRVADERIPIRVVWSRELPSAPKTVRIVRDATGRWWASFIIDVEPEDVGATGLTTGLDVGLTTYATTEYADADVPNPRFARAAAKALARSQRNCARKTVGSNNHAKARRQVAKVHTRVAAQRNDFTHKQARTLARRFDRIGVEDLRIANMVHNRRLARSILDAGWGNFLSSLEWHAAKCGHEVIRIDPRNTTQTCSSCGAKAKQRLELGDRTFACSECGHTEDRDRNAARNLNPNRRGKTGAGVDGSKTPVPAGNEAA